MELQILNWNRYFLLCFVAYLMLLLSYYNGYANKNFGRIPFKFGLLKTNIKDVKYLVDTTNCKIPDIDPFNSDIWPYYQKEEYLPCTDVSLLTYIERKQNGFYLEINQSAIHSYSSYFINSSLSCCFMDITRDNEDDNNITFSDCHQFKDSALIQSDLIKVRCSNSFGHEVYSNVHNIIRLTQEIHQRYKDNNLKNPFNVLLIGIDTMSQLNLIRTMPKTQQFLHDNNWIKLKGYNKVDDNTFPNLMALLSGMNLSQVNTICNPDENYLDDCEIIWKYFKRYGYVTGYAEDEGSLNTFSYLMKGFKEPPTDHYFRPYSLAVETLKIVRKYLLSYCTGPETSGERILRLIDDFCQTYPNMSKFGLFWMNSFSHNNINTASTMDDVFVQFFRKLYSNNYLENTIVVFFSDHGFRFGKIRYTYSGWLEERLPFNYIYIPEKFRKLHPDYYGNLIVNSRRLTTPFDIYMTLQHILHLANDSYRIRPSLACPNCRSLFEEVDELRSCRDAAISQHFCTCMGHFYIDPNSKIVKKATLFALDKLHSTINHYGVKSQYCMDYYLNRVLSSGVTGTFYNNKNESSNYLLLIFETVPKAVFEATVSITDQNSIPLFSLQGVISRIDRYGDKSSCVNDPVLRKYCYCDGFVTRLKKTMSILFNS